jgi:type-F conjugative transfer system pilin assembly protein TrbC
MAKKKLLFIVIFNFFFFSLLIAENNSVIENDFAENIAQLELSNDDFEFAKNKTYFGEKDCKNGCGSKILNRRPSGVTPVRAARASMLSPPVDFNCNGTKSLVVFVSFSMPDVSLKELDENAEKYGAILVMRGLFEGSFVKTKDKILAINKNGLHLDINPELFRRYNIYRVPTFVLLKNGKEVHRLSGNVTLEYASAKLREK